MIGIKHNERKARSLRDCVAIFRKRDYWQAFALFKLSLNDAAGFEADLFLIERRTTVIHNLLERRLEPKLETVRTFAANVEPTGVHLRGSIVDGSGLDSGLAEGKAQLRQMGGFVRLPTRGF